MSHLYRVQYLHELITHGDIFMPTIRQDGDSEKIKLIPEMMRWVSQLNQVIITGNVEKGEPGLLETIRNISKDVTDIKTRQTNYESLEQRVFVIEERHRKTDEENKQKKETMNKYNLTMFGVLFTQVVLLVIEFFKR